jgi:hypothetical protein
MTTKQQPRLLTKDDILDKEDRATEIVEVPEWGGAVTVRALSGTERDHYEGSMVRYQRTDKGTVEIKSVETENVRARLVSLSVVDEEGKRMFAEKDVLALGDKSAAALNRLFDVAQRLSALTNRDVEELEAGLKGDLNGTSGTD